MLVSAVVARLLRPPTRESLDGYMIGALGALAFTAAATLTRLVPQLPSGVVARTRPLTGLLFEALLRGVAVPLTAAALGGLIGAAVWFTGPALTATEADLPNLRPGYSVLAGVYSQRDGGLPARIRRGRRRLAARNKQQLRPDADHGAGRR